MLLLLLLLLLLLRLLPLQCNYIQPPEPHATGAEQHCCDEKRAALLPAAGTAGATGPRAHLALLHTGQQDGPHVLRRCNVHRQLASLQCSSTQQRVSAKTPNSSGWRSGCN
jgi:hypothetical protein